MRSPSTNKVLIDAAFISGPTALHRCVVQVLSAEHTASPPAPPPCCGHGFCPGSGTLTGHTASGTCLTRQLG